MSYKDLVSKIKGLPWQQLEGRDLVQVMVLGAAAAEEFAESLRIALKLYPHNRGLMAMAEGELNASNLQYGSYNKAGDHAEFLMHFLAEFRVVPWQGVWLAMNRYRERVAVLSDEVRAMSVFSREQELPGIFKNILEAEGWGDPQSALPAFRYYLERHIELDSGDVGHAELVADMPVDDRVAPFYEARLRMYEYIFREFALP